MPEACGVSESCGTKLPMCLSEFLVRGEEKEDEGRLVELVQTSPILSSPRLRRRGVSSGLIESVSTSRRDPCSGFVLLSCLSRGLWSVLDSSAARELRDFRPAGVFGSVEELQGSAENS